MKDALVKCTPGDDSPCIPLGPGSCCLKTQLVAIPLDLTITDKKYLDAYETVGLPLQEGKFTHHCITTKQLELLRALTDDNDEYYNPGSGVKVREYCDAALLGINTFFAQMFTLIFTIYYASF